MKIKIKVTEEILKESMNCHSDGLSTNCAIALAVREIFPRAAVGTWGMYIDNKFINEISFTYDVSVFIRRFDRSTPSERAKLTPISFDINVPDEVITRIGISQVESILSNSLTLEKV